MVFRERSYGVLVVSASGKFNSAMRELLPMTDFWPVDYAASVSEARRRLLELKQRGQETELETVLRDIVQRDEQDRNRPVAPLRQAEDAVLLDTTRLNLEESLAAILSLIKEKIHL